MRKRSKIVYLLLIVALVVNLVVPTSMVIANNQPVNDTSNTVTGDVYGSSARISALSVTQSVYEIPVNIITDVVMTNDKKENISVVRPDQGSKVQIDFKWELPANHPYLEGSTFTFNLPKHFILDSEKTGDLGIYGTFIVTPEGKVTFTFSKEIEGTAVTNGTFNVWRSFDEKSFVGGTHQDIEFIYQGESDIVPVHFLSKSTSEIDKKGTPNKGKNASEVSWEVDFNKGEKSITNAIFKDELPTGLTVDMNSIEVVELIVKLDGSVEEKTTPFIGNAPVPNVNGFQLDFGNINNAYRVKYTTTITGTSDKTYNNKVTVSGDNLPKAQETSKAVAVTYSKPINKTSTGYNSSTQTITWVIEYNYNEQKIAQSNAWIKDIFDKTTQALVPGSFKVTEMKIEDNGNATSKGVVTNYDIDETLADGFLLAFKDKIESAYRIEYKTTSINRVYGDAVAVKNTVEMSGVTPVDKTVNMNQVIFKKNNGKVNFNKKTIDWTINLNNDNQLMSDVVSMIVMQRVKD